MIWKKTKTSLKIKEKNTIKKQSKVTRVCIKIFLKKSYKSMDKIVVKILLIRKNKRQKIGK